MSIPKSMLSTMHFSIHGTKPRMKRVHFKVKTGCQACRERRIKCDEQYPSCNQCLKSKRKCPGYPPVSEAPKDQSSGSKPGIAKGRLNVHASSPLSNMPFESSDEHQSFQFYLAVSQDYIIKFYATSISPMFPDEKSRLHAEELNANFWKVTYPRLALIQPVVRQGLLLMSTVHQQLQSTQTPFTNDHKSLGLQLATVRGLRRAWKSLAIDTILVISLQLAMAELTAGPSASGFAYLFSGQRIIKQRRDLPDMYAEHADSAGVEDFTPEIELMFETFLCKLERDRGAVFPEEQTIPSSCELPAITLHLPFKTLDQALGSLETITRRAQVLMGMLSENVEQDDVDKLHGQAQLWLDAFEELGKTPKDVPDDSDRNALIIIRIHGLIARVCASVPRSENEYDKHHATFQEISKLLWEFMSISGKITESTLQQIPWGMGLVNATFFAATKARDSTVRNEFLRILSQIKMTEGPWTSCAAYQIALHISRLEKGLDVENEVRSEGVKGHRVRFQSATFVDDTRVAISYRKLQSDHCPSTQRHTFEIKSCQQQNALNKGPCVISEFGGTQGYVATSSCLCSF